MKFQLYLGGVFLGSFLIQLFIGCRTAYKVLRYIPLYCFAVTLIFAVKALRSSTLFIGLNALAALIWAMIGVCFVLGYGAAILVHKIIK